MWQINPQTVKKLRRFKSIKRGYYSFVLLFGMIALSLVAELLVNSKALMVKYDGSYYFPTYSDVIPGDQFGLSYRYATNYRELKAKFDQDGGDNWVLMPIVPWDPFEQDYQEGSYPPYAPDSESGHYLGTDKNGRDVLARIVYGFRIAITFAFLSMGVCFALGVTIGCAMGYLGGRFDLIVQRGIEIWSLVPFLYIIMIVASIVQPGLPALTGLFILFGWMGITWYMRSLTYKEKAREYVAAAHALGASDWRIIFNHILPNTIVMIVTLAPFFVVTAISALTALDYLGFGLRPPTPSWGELLLQGRSRLDAIWIVSSVVTAIVVVLTLVQFIGEAIREAFDPKRYTQYR